MVNLRFERRKGSLLIFHFLNTTKTAIGAELIANISLVPYNEIDPKSQLRETVNVVVLNGGSGMHTILPSKDGDQTKEELFDILTTAWEEAREATGYLCVVGSGG